VVVVDGAAAGAGVDLEDLGGDLAGAAAGDCARAPVAARRRRTQRTAALVARAIAGMAWLRVEWQRQGR
jgi:hypothetical protein